MPRNHHKELERCKKDFVHFTEHHIELVSRDGKITKFRLSQSHKNQLKCIRKLQRT